MPRRSWVLGMLARRVVKEGLRARNFWGHATLRGLMCPQTRRFLAGAVTLLALFAATPAHAATKGPTRGEKAVAKALRTAVAKKRIKRSSYNRYRKLYRSARTDAQAPQGRAAGASWDR